jgi:hypothetical protein
VDVSSSKKHIFKYLSKKFSIAMLEYRYFMEHHRRNSEKSGVFFNPPRSPGLEISGYHPGDLGPQISFIQKLRSFDMSTQPYY